MEKRYANRELDIAFKRADDRADEFHNNLMQRMDVFESNTSTALSRIEQQTTKTNGRVSELEVQARLSKARINLILWLITIFIAPVIVGFSIYYTTTHIL